MRRSNQTSEEVEKWKRGNIIDQQQLQKSQLLNELTANLFCHHLRIAGGENNDNDAQRFYVKLQILANQTSR